MQTAFLQGVSRVGDGISWCTENIIRWVSQYGYNITEIQSKVLAILILGSLVYGIITFLNSGKKFIKWGMIVAVIFLMFSVLLSVFT